MSESSVASSLAELDVDVAADKMKKGAVPHMRATMPCVGEIIGRHWAAPYACYCM